ncbi:MAG: AAA family ATPase [Planctomycetota bacterium]
MTELETIANRGLMARARSDGAGVDESRRELGFRQRLQEHLERDPTGLEVVKEQFPSFDHPNLHLAIEAFLEADGRRAEIVGFTPPRQSEISLVALASATEDGWREAPVGYLNVALDDGKTLACVQRGLYLIGDAQRPLVALLHGGHSFMDDGIYLEIMASSRETAEDFLAALRRTIRERNIYRGRVISLCCEHRMAGTSVRFHRLAPVRRDDIILPQGLLDRIEQLTIGFSKHRDKLLRAGRHLKRGLLLHGPPGTGKTLISMFLADQMRDRTVLLLAGQGLGMIEQSCTMARALQPATIIMEDIDLVAEGRTQRSCNALLFDLLNQMDGLAYDADVLFLLTTNRPDLLEPALATRPGRIDQAIEIPRPDAGCRRRLFEHYGRGLTMRCQEFDRLVAQTEGVTAAFVRELLRRAALLAAGDADEILVEDRHLNEALHQLVVDGGALTQKLLGAHPSTACNCSDGGD